MSEWVATASICEAFENARRYQHISFARSLRYRKRASLRHRRYWRKMAENVKNLMPP